MNICFDEEMNMNFDKYINTLPFPRSQTYTTYFHYKGGKCLGESNTLEPLVYGAIVEKVLDEDAYRAARDVHWAEDQRLKQMFFDDLTDEFCIKNHPKRDKFLYLCWQEGHSGGFSEVYNVACTWVELLEG
jgi:hypothetical protein